MISNKSNSALIMETLETFMANGLQDLKESMERLFNELMIAEREEVVERHHMKGPPSVKDIVTDLRIKSF